MKRVLLLAGVGLGLWLVLLVPGWWLQGDVALVQSGVALALSLLPNLVTMIWANLAWKNSPDMQLLAALGGSGLRMGVTLGIAALLYFQYPETYSAAFLGWVLVFYLVLLALEVTLLVRPEPASRSDDSKASI